MAPRGQQSAVTATSHNSAETGAGKQANDTYKRLAPHAAQTRGCTYYFGSDLKAAQSKGEQSSEVSHPCLPGLPACPVEDTQETNKFCDDPPPGLVHPSKEHQLAQVSSPNPCANGCEDPPRLEPPSRPPGTWALQDLKAPPGLEDLQARKPFKLSDAECTTEECSTNEDSSADSENEVPFKRTIELASSIRTPLKSSARPFKPFTPLKPMVKTVDMDSQSDEKFSGWPAARWQKEPGGRCVLRRPEIAKIDVRS